MAHLPNADLEEIAVFTQVVRSGSFTAAAAALGMPKSSVSRKLADLEQRVGARLLQRTTRSVSLTEVGHAYFERCARIVSELEDAEQLVSHMQAAPRGVLRVTIPVTFAVLGPILAEYLSRYPDVQVDLVSTGQRLDLIEERFDLALRAGPPPDSTLVGRKLGVVRKCVVASPELLARIGPVSHPNDLEKLECLTFTPDGDAWTLFSEESEVRVNVAPRLSANDYELIRSVARAGFGLALLPEYQCLDDVAAGSLVRVLDRWCAKEVPVFALYPSSRHLSPKVLALVELLRDRLELTLESAPQVEGRGDSRGAVRRGAP